MRNLNKFVFQASIARVSQHQKSSAAQCGTGTVKEDGFSTSMHIE